MGLTLPAPTASGISSLLPPSSCPPIKSLSSVCICVCVWMFAGDQLVQLAVGGEARGKRLKKELRETEPWLQSSMTQSGCIQCPWGKRTKHVRKHTALPPVLILCNQRVQMLTFPPLTSISMSLSPAAQSNNNRRRVSGKALLQSLFGLF